MTPSPLISLRPSDGHWLYGCTAAPQYIVENAHRIPPQDTEYSDEGKVAHACGEALIRGEKITAKRIAKQTELDIETVKKYLPEAKRHARAYADFVEQFKPEMGQGEWGVERKVDRFYQPGRPAIVDFFAVTSRKATVVDLKYGKGVAVHAVHNKQIAIYARGLIEQEFLHGIAPDELQVEMHIWQPRIMEGEKHTVWKTTWGELRTFTDDEIKSVAENIFAGKGLQFLVSDKTCRFCPMRKVGCKARQEDALKDFPLLEPITEGEMPVLPTADEKMLALLVKSGKKLIKWIEDEIDRANALVQNGQPIEGTKLVLGKGGHRSWSDPKAAAALLRQQFKPNVLWKKTLVTPAQTMEALEAMHAPEDYVKAVEALMVKPEGKPTLVGSDDKRPEWQPPSAADEFEDLTQQQEDFEWV